MLDSALWLQWGESLFETGMEAEDTEEVTEEAGMQMNSRQKPQMHRESKNFLKKPVEDGEREKRPLQRPQRDASETICLEQFCYVLSASEWSLNFFTWLPMPVTTLLASFSVLKSCYTSNSSLKEGELSSDPLIDSTSRVLGLKWYHHSWFVS